jgi:branched-chain amino acid transport system substrate-binding protein
MKRIFATLLTLGLLLTACGNSGTNGTSGGTAPCIDPLGCVTLGNDAPVVIAVELTLSGPNAPYGVDALRGVELAIADRGTLLNRSIELVQEDDLCTAEGGQAAAERLAQNPSLVGVIGATCTSASQSAAKVLTQAGLVLISPSSTAAALTSTAEHQEGFLRTIYNDQSQAQLVAGFAFQALGARTMVTVSDGSSYSEDLQQEACLLFEQRGGFCLSALKITTNSDVAAVVARVAQLNPEVLYIPVYTEDAVKIMTEMGRIDLMDTAVIGSDGLLNTEFARKARNADGMYISGPSTVQLDPAFREKYVARYGEEPVAVYAAQAYDAAMMLFDAIEVSVKTTGRDILIPRTTLRAALYSTKDYKGLSGILTCSPLGDCASPNIVIYQLTNYNFRVIYP